MIPYSVGNWRQPNLKIYRTHPAVPIPNIQTDGSACFDLAYCPAGKDLIQAYDMKNRHTPIAFYPNQEIKISPQWRVAVPTGLIFDIPKGYSVRIHVRSSIAYKRGLTLVNAEGIIDSDYTDEIFLLLTNTSYDLVAIQVGERLCQAELVKNLGFYISETEDKPKQKGNRIGGIGSTGS